MAQQRKNKVVFNSPTFRIVQCTSLSELERLRGATTYQDYRFEWSELPDSMGDPIWHDMSFNGGPDQSTVKLRSLLLLLCREQFGVVEQLK